MKTRIIAGGLSIIFISTGLFADAVVNGNNTATLTGSETGGFRITQGTTGEEALLRMTGDTTVAFTTDSRVGTSGASAGLGTATFEVSGSNNVFVMGTQSAGAGSLFLGDEMAAGTAQILISGSNNSLYYGSYVQGRALGAGASSLFSMTGSNNSYNHNGFRNHFRVGWNGTSNGTNTVYLKGDGPADNQKVYMNLLNTTTSNQYSDLDIAGSASNTGTNRFIMDGNAVLRGKEGSTDRVNVFINGGNSSGVKNFGSALFEVNGSGNTVYVKDVTVGNANQVSGSASTFRVSGGGSSIQMNSLIVKGSGGTSADIKGGIVEFVFAGDGVSTIEVTNLSEFSGILMLDFSAFGADGSYDLISASNDWSAVWSAFGWDNDTHSASSGRIVITGAAAEEVTFNYAAGALTASYASLIPEPGVYALIFGALSLLFALRSRRR